MRKIVIVSEVLIGAHYHKISNESPDGTFESLNMKKVNEVKDKLAKNHNPLSDILANGLAKSAALVNNFSLNAPKKQKAENLKKNLQKKINEIGLFYDVKLDTNDGDLKYIKKDGANLILISPYIYEWMDFDGIEKADYYELSTDEFDNGKTDKIMEYLMEIVP